MQNHKQPIHKNNKKHIKTKTRNLLKTTHTYKKQIKKIKANEIIMKSNYKTKQNDETTTKQNNNNEHYRKPIQTLVGNNQTPATNT